MLHKMDDSVGVRSSPAYVSDISIIIVLGFRVAGKWNIDECRDDDDVMKEIYLQLVFPPDAAKDQGVDIRGIFVTTHIVVFPVRWWIYDKLAQSPFWIFSCHPHDKFSWKNSISGGSLCKSKSPICMSEATKRFLIGICRSIEGQSSSTRIRQSQA